MTKHLWIALVIVLLFVAVFFRYAPAGQSCVVDRWTGMGFDPSRSVEGSDGKLIPAPCSTER